MVLNMDEEEEAIAILAEDFMEHVDFLMVRGAEMQEILDALTAVMIYLVEMRDQSDAETLDMLGKVMFGKGTMH